MRNYLKLAFIFILLVFLSTSGVLNQGPQAFEQRLAADFRLPDMEGNSVTLSGYQNRQVVILLFWTTWCYFCRKELSMLNHQYIEFKHEGVEILIINVGESKATVENFIKRYNLNLKVLLDEDLAVARDYNVFGVPSYILIDKKGYIVSEGNYFPQKEYQDLINVKAQNPK